MKDIAKEYKTLRSILEHCDRIDERLTSQKLIDSWSGKGPSKLRLPDYKGTSISRENCERIVALLLLDSYLVEEFHFTHYNTISYINTGKYFMYCLNIFFFCLFHFRYRDVNLLEALTVCRAFSYKFIFKISHFVSTCL